MNEIDTSSWRKFKIGDLFVSHNGNVDIQKKHINGKGNFVVSSGMENSGIIGKSDIEAKIFPPGTLTVDMFGNVFYRDFSYKMVTHARVFSLSMKDTSVVLNEKIGLFLSTSLLFLSKMFSFSNMATFDKISNITIKLPVKTTEVPDWDYMQEYIAKLEQERIVELEKYLVATGLNDCKLTDEDIKVLSGIRCSKEVYCVDSTDICRVMKEFRISNVFDLYKGRRLIKAEHFYGNTPFIGSTESNNGITGYIGQNPIFDKNAITISYNGSVGEVFYQEKSFWASDDINVLYLKNHILDRKLFEYLGTSLYKSGKKFSYTYKWNLERMRETMIILPIKTDATNKPIIDNDLKYHPDGFIPDWDYMDAYIRAIEKLVIKDVVDFKDAFIAGMKSVVKCGHDKN